MNVFFKTQQITAKQRDLFKMATIGINTSLQTLREVVYDLDQSFQADFRPRLLKCSFQRIDVRMRFLTRFFFKDGPHGVVERVEVGTVRRPFAGRGSPMGVDGDHIGAVVAEEVLSLTHLVCRGPVYIAPRNSVRDFIF